MNHKEILWELGVEKEVVMEFFVVFSRFEFALKKAGYLRAGRECRALPDWTTFESRYEDCFDTQSEPKLSEAWDYVYQNPPMRQVVADGRLDFETDPRLDDKSPFKRATLAVRTVRNNLFHGGKFPNSGVVDDPARKTKLLRTCLRLLYEMLELAPDVKAEFEHVENRRPRQADCSITG